MLRSGIRWLIFVEISDASHVKSDCDSGHLGEATGPGTKSLHALMGAFRTGQLNKDLLHATYRMLNFLVRLLDNIPTRNVLNECEKDASFLLGLKNHYGTAAGVMHDLLEFKTLPVEECGDLIRFYGEVIDKLAEKVGGRFLSDRARQIGWRYGGGGEA